MVLETAPLVFFEWLSGAWLDWLATVGLLLLLGVVGSFLVLAVRDGPLVAGDRVYGVVVSSVLDLVFMSPRRVWAIARLAVQESLRRRVLAGFGVFFLILLFALFFLDSTSIDPTRLYIDFVLTCTMFLSLVMALLLSAFSLPTDVKNRTIYTVVTKPVRPSEVVLGRMLGFSLIGSVALVLMAGVSYGFVVSSARHTHELSAGDLLESSELLTVGDRSLPPGTRQGNTSRAQNHRHRVTVDAQGNGVTETAQGHWHEVRSVERGGQRFYEVGPPRGQFHARVPIYGTLRFKDPSGTDSAKGVNVGNIWTYRSFLAGGTLASANWTFRDVRSEMFPDGLRMELTIRVFRTHKGDDEGILGSIVLRNPRTGVSSAPRNFLAKEYSVDQHVFPRRLTDASGKTIDLFDDLVSDGTLEVQLQCLPRGQFYGMAQGDVYLLPREASFDANFFKGFIGIWLQMLLVTALGVMWSTFLTGPVAVLTTLATAAAGFFLEFIRKLAAGEVDRGGTFESLVRIVNQKPVSVDLDEGLGTSVITVADSIIQRMLGLFARVIPDLWSLADMRYVSAGYDIPVDRLLVHGVTTLGFLVPIFLIAFVLFKTREVAR